MSKFVCVMCGLQHAQTVWMTWRCCSWRIRLGRDNEIRNFSSSTYVSSSLCCFVYRSSSALSLDLCQTPETSRREEKQSQNERNVKWIKFLERVVYREEGFVFLGVRVDVFAGDESNPVECTTRPERKCVCVCVCVCERERERERERESRRKKEKKHK